MPYPEQTLSWQLQSLLITISLIGMFFPFYIGIVVFFVIFIILAATGMLKITGLQENHAYLSLWIFIFYSLIISLIYSNWIGALISSGFILSILYFTYYSKNIRPAFFEEIINFSLIGSVVVFAFAMLQHLHFVPEWDYTFIWSAMNRVHINRVEATFFNPNYYAMMLEFFIVLCLYKGMRTKKKYKKLTYTLIGLLNALAIVFTACRTSFAVIVVAFFIYFYVVGYKKQAVGVAVFLSILLIILSLTHILPRTTDILFAIEDRFVIWEASLAAIKDNFLFGQGPLTYMHVYSEYTTKYTQHAHNIFLDALLNYGIAGCALLALPLYRYAKLLNTMRQYPRLRNRLALMCSLTTVVIAHGLTDVTIFWIQTAFFFFWIILAAPNMIKEEQQRLNTTQTH